eukprot:CFRG1891T1
MVRSATPVHNDGCCVFPFCEGEERQSNRSVLSCSGSNCEVRVHPECYGLDERIDNFECDRCKDGSVQQVACVLCPGSTGAFRRTVDGEWVHIICAIWTKCDFSDLELLSGINIKSLTYPSASIEGCCICKEKGRESKAATGVTIPCKKSSCSLYVHVSCAQSRRLLRFSFKEDMVCAAYCPKHGSRQDPEKSKSSGSSSTTGKSLYRHDLKFTSNSVAANSSKEEEKQTAQAGHASTMTEKREHKELDGLSVNSEKRRRVRASSAAEGEEDSQKPTSNDDALRNSVDNFLQNQSLDVKEFVESNVFGNKEAYVHVLPQVQQLTAANKALEVRIKALEEEQKALKGLQQKLAVKRSDKSSGVDKNLNDNLLTAILAIFGAIHDQDIDVFMNIKDKDNFITSVFDELNRESEDGATSASRDKLIRSVIRKSIEDFR